eukprot:m.901546 g.901546  ORF g.901546 m.901546 type:complete len:858 (-) comp23688_c0_seq6:2150-4723(-)
MPIARSFSSARSVIVLSGFRVLFCLLQVACVCSGQDVLSSQYDDLGRGCCANASTEAIAEESGEKTQPEEPFESHTTEEVCILSRRYVFDSRYPSCTSFYTCLQYCHNTTGCTATGTQVNSTNCSSYSMLVSDGTSYCGRQVLCDLYNGSHIVLADSVGCRTVRSTFNGSASDTQSITGHCYARNTTDSPTSIPTLTPTHLPTLTPTRSPTRTPSHTPTHTPTHGPTRQPTPQPTTRPTQQPTRPPTPAPTQLPTHLPTLTPTPTPTQTPSQSPTLTPTRAPTQVPTLLPTQIPTPAPTTTPTQVPIRSPTRPPTQVPTQTPTQPPTQPPTQVPTQAPTRAPTQTPTQTPTPITQAPTQPPTQTPTQTPTQVPTPALMQTPTHLLTLSPTLTPTLSPIQVPTQLLTLSPTTTPTRSVSRAPTRSLSRAPTQAPVVRAPTQTPALVTLPPTPIMTLAPSPPQSPTVVSGSTMSQTTGRTSVRSATGATTPLTINATHTASVPATTLAVGATIPVAATVSPPSSSPATVPAPADSALSSPTVAPSHGSVETRTTPDPGTFGGVLPASTTLHPSAGVVAGSTIADVDMTQGTSTATAELPASGDGPEEDASNTSGPLVPVIAAVVAGCIATLLVILCCRAHHSRPQQHGYSENAKQTASVGDTVGMMSNPVFDTQSATPLDAADTSVESSGLVVDGSSVYYSVPILPDDTTMENPYSPPAEFQTSPHYSVFNDKPVHEDTTGGERPIHRYTVFKDVHVEAGSGMYTGPVETEAADTKSQISGGATSSVAPVVPVDGTTTTATSTDASDLERPFAAPTASCVEYAVMNDIGNHGTECALGENVYAYGVLPSQTDTLPHSKR